MAEKQKGQSERIKICPYWRRVAVVGGEQGPTIIALCGRKDEKEGPLPPLADFGDRLGRCPYGFGRDVAFDNPAVLVIKNGKVEKLHVTLESYGHEAIRLLSSNWSRLIRKYRSRF